MRRSFLGGNNKKDDDNDENKKDDLDHAGVVAFIKNEKKEKEYHKKQIPVPETPPRLPRGMSVLLVSFSAPTTAKKDARGGKEEQQQL